MKKQACLHKCDLNVRFVHIPHRVGRNNLVPSADMNMPIKLQSPKHISLWQILLSSNCGWKVYSIYGYFKGANRLINVL